MGKQFFVLLRPKHWIKNVFVLAPLIFSFQFLVFSLSFRTFAIVISFSLAASSVYIINDIFDIERDRNHPEKKNRPIASGRVPIRSAVFLIVILIINSLCIAFLISIYALLILSIYIVINFLYSSWLKHLTLIDVFVIAIGFVLRVISGAVAANVAVSEWIILVTFFLSLFLGFSKRYNEISYNKHQEHREVLGSYSQEMLLIFMIMSSVLTIVIYTFYTIDPVTLERFNSQKLLYSVPIVVFGVLRYFQLVVHENLGGDVADVITKDFYIIATVILWLMEIIWSYRW